VPPGAFDPTERARLFAALTKLLADATLLHSAGDMGPEFRDLLQRAGTLLGMVIGVEASADPTDGGCAARRYDVWQLDPRLVGQSESRTLH